MRKVQEWPSQAVSGALRPCGGRIGADPSQAHPASATGAGVRRSWAGALASPGPRRVRCPVARTVGRTVAGNGICQRYTRQRWFCPDNAGLRSMQGGVTACPRRRRGGLRGLRTLPDLQAPQGAFGAPARPPGSQTDRVDWPVSRLEPHQNHPKKWAKPFLFL